MTEFNAYHCTIPSTHWRVGEIPNQTIHEDIAVAELDQNWAQVGRTARRLATTVQQQYPAIQLQAKTMTLFNELLENVVKYGRTDANGTFELRLFERFFEMEISHLCRVDQAKEFQMFLEKLSGNYRSKKSFNRIFHDRIQFNSISFVPKSEFGLLMILKSNQVTFKIDLNPVDDDGVAVTTRVQFEL